MLSLHRQTQSLEWHYGIREMELEKLKDEHSLLDNALRSHVEEDGVSDISDIAENQRD